ACVSCARPWSHLSRHRRNLYAVYPGGASGALGVDTLGYRVGRGVSWRRSQGSWAATTPRGFNVSLRHHGVAYADCRAAAMAAGTARGVVMAIRWRYGVHAGRRILCIRADPLQPLHMALIRAHG